MHFVGTFQSLGLFFVVCLATATLLSLAMAGLARMERATVPAPRPGYRDRRPSTTSDRVSSAGSCTYGPRDR